MPTVILLDVSLSMCRPVRAEPSSADGTGASATAAATIVDAKQLANVGIGTLLDYFAQNAQLEHTALIVFSSLWEIKHHFTRHHESIKNGIYDLELYDRSNVVNAVRGALSLKLPEWTQHGPINIVLITDGQVYHESMCNRQAGGGGGGNNNNNHSSSNNNHNHNISSSSSAHNNSGSRRPDSRDGEQEDEDEEMDDEDEEAGAAGPSNSADGYLDLPLSSIENKFDFPCKIQIVCLASSQEPALKHGLAFYQRLACLVDSSLHHECPVLAGPGAKSAKESAIWLAEGPEGGQAGGPASIEAVEALFLRLAEKHYKPYHATLAAGHLSSTVMLSPRPGECLVEPLKNEFDDLVSEQALKERAKETYVSSINRSRLFKLSGEINICGFMPLAEVASPAVVSRHLVLPVASCKFNETSKAEQILAREPAAAYRKSAAAVLECELEPASSAPEAAAPAAARPAGAAAPPRTPRKGARGAQSASSPAGEQPEAAAAKTRPEPAAEPSKQPSFCVLLHNGLRAENAVAVCLVGRSEDSAEDWFGLLHAHTDPKKRSCLLLSLLTPGPSPVAWLASFKALGSPQLNADLPAALRDKIELAGRGPLKSYASNNVIWLDPESVQTDVSKIVRHAKRPPDKAPHFYKELNRIRRAALAYGFYDVLHGLADILEREKQVLLADQSKSVNQETLSHIDHVVLSLKAELAEDSYETSIAPRARPDRFE